MFKPLQELIEMEVTEEKQDSIKVEDSMTVVWDVIWVVIVPFWELA